MWMLALSPLRTQPGQRKMREQHGSAPILVACMCLIVGLLFLPETKDVDITK
jgi:hypothetical protein